MLILNARWSQRLRQCLGIEVRIRSRAGKFAHISNELNIMRLKQRHKIVELAIGVPDCQHR